jgi:hypothetical protein
MPGGLEYSRQLPANFAFWPSSDRDNGKIQVGKSPQFFLEMSKVRRKCQCQISVWCYPERCIELVICLLHAVHAHIIQSQHCVKLCLVSLN